MTSPPRDSFKRTQESLHEMENATELEALQDAWEDFLIYHQRTWNRCEAYYKGKPFWVELRRKYATIRTQDSLLQYVHHARHAEEHGIDPSSTIQQGFTILGPGEYTSGTTVVGGNEYVLGPGSTGTVLAIQASVRTKPVVNRSVKFDPPVINGETDPLVIEVAREALKFYEALFANLTAAGDD